MERVLLMGDIYEEDETIPAVRSFPTLVSEDESLSQRLNNLGAGL